MYNHKVGEVKGEEGRSGSGWGWDLRSKGRSRWRYAKHNRAGLGFLFCSPVKLYVCLLFRIEYFFSFLYRRYPLLAILGRVPVIRYGGQESAGGGDRCRSAVENGYLLSRVSLPLEATSTSIIQAQTHLWTSSSGTCLCSSAFL